MIKKILTGISIIFMPLLIISFNNVTCAEKNTDNETKIGLGVFGGNISGNGISYRHGFNKPNIYQISGLLTKDEHKIDLSIGFEYGRRIFGKNPSLYSVFGIAILSRFDTYSKDDYVTFYDPLRLDSIEVKNQNEDENNLVIGGGIGVDFVFFKNAGFVIEIVESYNIIDRNIKITTQGGIYFVW